MFGAFAPFPVRLGGKAEDGLVASQHARLCADVVALARVAPVAAWSYEQDFNTPYPVTMLNYCGQNGSGLAHAPTVTVNDLGHVSFAWTGAYLEDEYEQQFPVRIRAGIALAKPRSASQRDNIGVVEIISGGVKVYTMDCGSDTAVACVMSVKVW